MKTSHYRPEIHFTAKEGWINDPNGLVYENGNYHLFAQFYPGPVWGPMHWYHAVSRDLIHWEHLPVAMAPDELGYIYSGSAVIDTDNTSGFGEDGKPPMIAMFTHHWEEEGVPTNRHEQQSIAWSTDYINFHKYEGNPIIPSNMPDFRDPKVFKNPKGGWSVVMSGGDRALFYASDDLKNWRKTGEFGPEGNYSGGVWECPDFFPLTVNGEEKWVLLVSMGPFHDNHGSRTQYFVGDFDGEKFICDGRFDKPEFIDEGFDNYASVSYAGTDKCILVGWASNWVYAREIPTEEEGFRSCMTLAREFSLADTPLGGVRIAQKPITGEVFDEGKPSDGTLPGELFRLTVRGEGAGSVTLKNGEGESFTFGVNENNEMYIDRSNAGQKDFNKEFGTDWFSKYATGRLYQGSWEMDLIFDHELTELFIDGGTRALTNLVFPTAPYDQIETSGNASVTVHTGKA